MTERADLAARACRKFLAIAGLLLAMPCASVPVHAQCANQSPAISGGENVFGAIVSQWKAYFAAKIDANNGCSVGQNLINPRINGGAIQWQASPNNTLVGNASGATAPAYPLTPTQVWALLGTDTSVPPVLAIPIDTTGGVGTVGTSGAKVGLLNANKTDSGNNDWTGGVAGTVAPHTATLATLQALTIANFPNGVWRDDYAATGGSGGGPIGAAPLFYKPETGTCAANSRTNDGGSCVNEASSNSFYAVFPNGVYDPAEFGATGQGSTTDDTTAIQNAINAMEAANGRMASQGKTYCIKTGPLEVGGNGRNVGGTGSLATTLSACGADVSILEVGNNLAASDGYFHDMFIAGSQTLGTTHPAIISTYCGHCTWQNLRVVGGSNSMNVTANNYNATFLGGFYFDSYNVSANFLTAGAGLGWFYGTTFDLAYPTGNTITATGTSTQCAANCTFSAWAGSTSYVYGNIVQVTQGGVAYLLQDITSGTHTSGSSAPTVVAYNVSIPDSGGTITWSLAGPTNQVELEINGGVQTWIVGADITGCCTSGVLITGGASQISLSHSTTGLNIFGGITADNASQVSVEDVVFAGGLAPSYTGVCANCGGTFGGVLQVKHNTFSGPFAEAVSLTGSNDIVSDNVFNGGGIGEGVFISGAQTNLNITNNIFAGTGTPIGGISNAGSGSFIAGNAGYNPVGISGSVNVGTSPATITNGPTPATLVVAQSATNTATVATGGVITCTVTSTSNDCLLPLGAGASAVVTWSTTDPTYRWIVQ